MPEIISLEVNSLKGIDILFIAEGFTEAQQSVFDAKVQSSIDGLMTFEPFKSNRRYFNFYKYNTVSVESGVSIIDHPKNPQTPVTKDNYWGGYKNKNGLIRLIDISEEKKNELYELIKDNFDRKVHVIFIFNDSSYGGAGNFQNKGDIYSMSLVMLDNQYNTYKELLAHEFGHSFGDLDDEYVDSVYASENPCILKHDKANITDDPINNRKWDFLPNAQYIEGGKYLATGKWRSSQSSLMRGWFEPNTIADESFNDLQKILIRKIIKNEYNYNLRLTVVRTDGPFSVLGSHLIHLKVTSNIEVNTRLYCKTLHILKGCSVTIGPSGTLVVSEIINNGELINNGKIVIND
jgi:hypothetical protein